jgi:hypothetical protein
MKIKHLLLALGFLLVFFFCRGKPTHSVTVPFDLDHNRMLIDGEMKRADGSWRPVRLWVDTGNPDFFICRDLALDLGIDLSQAPVNSQTGHTEIPPPEALRIQGMDLNLDALRSVVIPRPFWLFSTMHNQANLPSTILKRYQVIFDYPKGKLTLAKPGTHNHRGERIPADVHPDTGIVQIDVHIENETLSFALDNGASYSFGSEKVFNTLSGQHRDWPVHTGAIGRANIWGWGRSEESWPMIRIPEIVCGSIRFSNTGLVCPPDFSPGGPGMMDYYSKRTFRPVDGFFGPNVFRNFRFEIDFVGGAVYLEESPVQTIFDTDMVGLTLRPEEDGGYSVIGFSESGATSGVFEIQPGDRLVKIDDLQTRHATMGTVIDALRGKPGDIHVLVLERNGRRFQVEAQVRRLLDYSEKNL